MKWGSGRPSRGWRLPCQTIAMGWRGRWVLSWCSPALISWTACFILLHHEVSHGQVSISWGSVCRTNKQVTAASLRKKMCGLEIRWKGWLSHLCSLNGTSLKIYLKERGYRFCSCCANLDVTFRSITMDQRSNLWSCIYLFKSHSHWVQYNLLSSKYVENCSFNIQNYIS